MSRKVKAVVPRRYGDSGQLFTQVHYDALAKVLVLAHQRTGFGYYASSERQGIEHVRQELLILFTRDDPAFNANRFSDRTQPLLSAIANDGRVARP